MPAFEMPGTGYDCLKVATLLLHAAQRRIEACAKALAPQWLRGCQEYKKLEVLREDNLARANQDIDEVEHLHRSGRFLSC